MTAAAPTLLYIDDDAALARLVDRGLTRLGFNVVHAASGQRGLDRLQQGGIDVVALDQYMPGLDGLETLERILAIPNAPPVVFVTASQDSKHRRHRAEGRRRRLSGQGRAGRFHSAAAGRGRRRAAAGRAFRRPATTPRPRSTPRATATRRSPPSARCCCARSITASATRLQIIASLLHLQANSSTQDDVKAALTNAMGRVAAVAQVHRRLYTSHDLKSVLLNQYLDALLEDLRRSAEGNRMSRLTLKAEPVEIDPDRAVAIGIIVNELVMNAVKYAYPDGAGPIHVELHARRRRSRAVDRRRRRRPQRQDRPALHRHGPAHRHRDGRPSSRPASSAIPAMPAPGSCCGFAASAPRLPSKPQRRRELIAAQAQRQPGQQAAYAKVESVDPGELTEADRADTDAEVPSALIWPVA